MHQNRIFVKIFPTLAAENGKSFTKPQKETLFARF
jgi:hypothetical protein